MSMRGLLYGGLRLARSVTGIGRHNNFRFLEVAIVLLLPDEVHHQIHRLQLELLRRHGLSPSLCAPPHITLKLGFKCQDVEAVAEYLAELAARVPPLPLSLKNFSHFDEGIIFLDVEANPALEQLRRNLLHDLAQRYRVEPRPIEQSGYHFHVTLTYGLPRRIFNTELARFTNLSKVFSGMGDRLALLVNVGGHWVTYKSCALTAAHDIHSTV
ncbi:MAG: 2'-5' RNA ligase family protein [Leptothrix sp. (in: b-proteobacteria)]